jgi:hypothetical protein
MRRESAAVDVTAGPADRVATRNFSPGLLLAAAVLCVYGGIAVSVDFPRTAMAFQSDEATYYMMGHSLAEDGDLTYRRGDLVRVWRDFRTGPSGVFLKKGRDIVDAGLMLRPPFFWTATVPDPDAGRLFYGKSFIYPLFAWPFVELFGTNGFLVLNALLLSLAVWCSYLFLHARMPPAIAASLAGAFVLATVVPVYYVWITPELFNFAIGLLAYFCWLYKEVEVRECAPRGMRWLFGASSDIAAAALLGIATFSKVSNAALFPPIVLWLAWRRRWMHGAMATAVFVLLAGGLFAANMAMTGEWNYQGGDRKTFYFEFPFQTLASGFEGDVRARDEALTDVIFNRSVFLTNLVNNFKWFFVGRYSGLVAYFFPSVFALAAFLLRPRQRPLWQYLVFAAGMGQILLFIISLPYTWFGGGGSVGNRYFMGAHGVFLFLMPPVTRTWMTVVPWVIGGIFVGKLVINPFVSSVRPGEYADAGPLRLLPVELSNVNDLPINTDPSRVRVWFGDNPGLDDPGFQIYFVDRNNYGREEDKSFWVEGESKAEFLIKTDRPFRRIALTLTAGPVATRVDARVAGRSQQVALVAGASHRILFDLGPGYPYEARAFVWVASVSSSNGFVPLFYEPSDDARYLGVRVKPIIIP